MTVRAVSRRCIQAVVPLLALAGCPKKNTGFLVGIQGRSGYECREVRVGVFENDVETHRVGCSATVWFENDETSLEVAMPIPNDRSDPELRRWSSSSPPTRRHVQINAPGQRDDNWMVDVESAVVGAEGLSSDEVRLFELDDHRFVVFVVKEQGASSTVYATPFVEDRSVRDLYRENRGYCHEYAKNVRVYLADPEKPANERVFLPEGALQGLPIFCSRTDDHVFAIDLQDREEQVFDIVIEYAARLPRIFRLTTEPRANYTVIDVTLQRQSG